MLEKIIAFFSVPIMILNFGSGIVGGIWLAFKGEWGLLGIGIVLYFIYNWILSLLMMLSMPIALLALKSYERKNYLLGHLLGFLSQFYTNLLVVGTCALAVFICTRSYSGSESGIIPYLLWSWGMALGPWQFFASKEPDNEFSAVSLFSASVFYLIFLMSIFVSPFFVSIIIVTFLLVQLIVLPIMNLYVAHRRDRLVIMD